MVLVSVVSDERIEGHSVQRRTPVEKSQFDEHAHPDHLGADPTAGD